MSDNLNPETSSTKRGKDQNSRSERAKKNKRKSKLKNARIVAVFAIIEVIAKVLSQKADDFPGFSSHFIHSVSECLYLSGGAYVLLELAGGKRKWIGRMIWAVWLVLCVALFITKSTGMPPDESWKPTGLLMPGNDPMPPTPYLTNYPSEQNFASTGDMVIFFGSFVVSTPQSNFVVLKLYGENLLTLSKVGNGLAVSSDIWSAEGKLLATITTNKFHVLQNDSLYFDRPNSSTLIVTEAQNGMKTVVLSVQFLNSHVVKIIGVFRSKGKTPVIATDDSLNFGPMFFGSGLAPHLNGQPLFEWPGSLEWLTNETTINAAGFEKTRPSLRTFSHNGLAGLLLEFDGEIYPVLQMSCTNIEPGIVCEFKLNGPIKQN